MELRITVTTHEEQARQDREFWRNQTPEARLDAVERLRLVFGVLRGTQDQILDMLPEDNYGLLPR